MRINPGRFENRTALITGCGGENGIGFATARLMLKSGAAVAITSTTDRIFQRKLSLESIGGLTEAYIADLTDYSQAEKLVEQVVRKFGRLDILVNNAGMTQVGSPEKFTYLSGMDPDEWRRSLDRNLNTCFNVTRAALPYMLENEYGRIVNVSSVTGPLVSNPGATSYSAAKAGILGLTRSLAIETAQRGVTVNCAAPGWIATGSSTEEEIEAGRNTPIGRPGRPDEAADLIAFLASDESSYITGQMIVIDGGNIIQEYKGPRENYY